MHTTGKSRVVAHLLYTCTSVINVALIGCLVAVTMKARSVPPILSTDQTGEVNYKRISPERHVSLERKKKQGQAVDSSGYCCWYHSDKRHDVVMCSAFLNELLLRSPGQRSGFSKNFASLFTFVIKL